MSVIESRSMRWTGHVAHMAETRNSYKMLVEKPEGKRQLGKNRHRGEVLLKWILRKYGVMLWTGLNWLTIGTSGGLL
jgi:hypothetical protein